MFGLGQREHDERYAVADEWAQVLKQLWTTPGEVDFHGRWFDVPAGFSEPKPVQQPYPVVMNAGTSPAGRAFAARHSDLIFAGLTRLDTAAQQIAEIKALARENGREIRVFGRGHIVCDDTDAAAEARFDSIHRHRADIAGARNVVRINVPNSHSADWEALEMRRIVEGMVAGFWALPLIGTADRIVGTILDLHAAGMDGLAVDRRRRHARTGLRRRGGPRARDLVQRRRGAAQRLEQGPLHARAGRRPDRRAPRPVGRGAARARRSGGRPRWGAARPERGVARDGPGRDGRGPGMPPPRRAAAGDELTLHDLATALR